MRDGSIEIAWAGGEHIFRLGIAEAEKVQDECDAGPPVIAARLARSIWRVQDIRAPILWGLIGGGLPAAEAQKLVKQYLIPPMAQHVMAAQAIITSFIVAPADDVAEDEPSGDDPNAEAAEVSQEGK